LRGADVPRQQQLLRAAGLGHLVRIDRVRRERARHHAPGHLRRRRIVQRSFADVVQPNGLQWRELHERLHGLRLRAHVRVQHHDEGLRVGWRPGQPLLGRTLRAGSDLRRRRVLQDLVVQRRLQLQQPGQHRHLHEEQGHWLHLERRVRHWVLHRRRVL
jgi:hypothetical protein